jgi:hypothetical protein
MTGMEQTQYLAMGTPGRLLRNIGQVSSHSNLNLHLFSFFICRFLYILFLICFLMGSRRLDKIGRTAISSDLHASVYMTTDMHGRNAPLGPVRSVEE